MGNKFITGHNNAIKFWSLDRATGKLSFVDCQLGHHKRFINCVTIDPTDTFAYFGTRSGDILEVFIDSASYKRSGPVHKIFYGGIHQINCALPNSLVVSTAQGCIGKVNRKTMVFDEEVNL